MSALRSSYLFPKFDPDKEKSPFISCDLKRKTSVDWIRGLQPLSAHLNSHLRKQKSCSEKKKKLMKCKKSAPTGYHLKLVIAWKEEARKLELIVISGELHDWHGNLNRFWYEHEYASRYVNVGDANLRSMKVPSVLWRQLRFDWVWNLSLAFTDFHREQANHRHIHTNCTHSAHTEGWAGELTFWQERCRN